MNAEVLKYLKKHTTQLPKDIDRLIVSAYLAATQTNVSENNFIKGYIIGNDDPPNEREALSDFLHLLHINTVALDFEHLIELFEFVISPSDKVINGAVYTPEYIRQYIVKQSFLKTTRNLAEIKAADISCGCGGFLLSLAKELHEQTGRSFSQIFQENIFGLDIADYSITRTKILLALYAITNGEDEPEFAFNLVTDNALLFNWRENNPAISRNNGFDIIVGNPPYVCSRNMDLPTLKLIKELEVGKTGHPDLYIPFFQIGIEHLNDAGILSYITVNTFIKSVNGRALREYFSQKSIELTILNFGGEQVFEDRNTYTCICFIQNSPGRINYIRTQSDNLNNVNLNTLHSFNYDELDNHKGWNLVNDEATSTFITIIENTGVSFGELFDTKNGIATLKNDIYKFRPVEEDESFYYLKEKNKTYPIEKNCCRDIVNANKIKSEEDINSLREKIIFPYDENIKILAPGFFKANYPKAFTYLSSKKAILANRDKGKGEKEYEQWYAYGRKQSMDIHAYKLFFPHICERPSFVICTEMDLLFYNGIAIVSNDLEELRVIKKILESNLFFKYISNTTKDYASGYISMSRNYLKHFGVYQFTDEQKTFLLENDEYEDFLEELYAVNAFALTN